MPLPSSLPSQLRVLPLPLPSSLHASLVFVAIALFVAIAVHLPVTLVDIAIALLPSPSSLLLHFRVLCYLCTHFTNLGDLSHCDTLHQGPWHLQVF
jgi:hypothetical protein